LRRLDHHLLRVLILRRTFLHAVQIPAVQHVPFESKGFKTATTTVALHLRGWLVDFLELAQNVVRVLKFKLLISELFILTQQLGGVKRILAHSVFIGCCCSSCASSTILLSWTLIGLSWRAKISVPFTTGCIDALPDISLSLDNFLDFSFFSLQAFICAG